MNTTTPESQLTIWHRPPGAGRWKPLLQVGSQAEAMRYIATMSTGDVYVGEPGIDPNSSKERNRRRYPKRV